MLAYKADGAAKKQFRNQAISSTSSAFENLSERRSSQFDKSLNLSCSDFRKKKTDSPSKDEEQSIGHKSI